VLWESEHFMQISIKGIDKLQAQLSDAANKQLRFALSKALNDTLKGAHQAAVKEIKDVFDRPVPVVQRGVRWSASTKATLSGSVHIVRGEGSGFDVGRVLLPHITGADRVVKASESVFRRSGLMGQGQWMVPGPGAPLEQRSGNISGSYMKKLIAQMHADQALGYNKMSRKAAKRGVGTLYGIPLVGVFKRTGPQSSIPVLLFTYRKPRYEADRLDFQYVVRSYVVNNFAPNLAKAWAGAIRTAR
jgi:hypothetical protein